MKTVTSFFFVLVLIACSNMKKFQGPPLGAGGLAFDKQGHRGCRGLMPENTVPAMKAALELGVTTLEMDIVFTKDKEAVVSHEPFFNHEITTKPDGSSVTQGEEKSLNIYEMSYAAVKNYDVGMKPHSRFPRQQKLKVYKPLLSDLLDSVAHYMMTSKRALPYFNIETKTNPGTDNIYHPAPEVFVDELMKVIYSKNIEDRVIIQSFDFRTLQYVHQHYPTIKTAVLIEDFDKRSLEEQIQALGFVPSIYSPAYQLVDEELVRKCHTQNMKVIPWTVNDKETITKLQAIGVDGLISDYPNLFNE